MNQIAKALWEDVEEGPECQDCKWLLRVKDAYYTGDSPMVYKCLAPTEKHCWRVEEALSLERIKP